MAAFRFVFSLLWIMSASAAHAEGEADICAAQVEISTGNKEDRYFLKNPKNILRRPLGAAKNVQPQNYSFALKNGLLYVVDAESGKTVKTLAIDRKNLVVDQALRLFSHYKYNLSVNPHVRIVHFSPEENRLLLAFRGEGVVTVGKALLRDYDLTTGLAVQELDVQGTLTRPIASASDMTFFFTQDNKDSGSHLTELNVVQRVGGKVNLFRVPLQLSKAFVDAQTKEALFLGFSSSQKPFADNQIEIKSFSPARVTFQQISIDAFIEVSLPLTRVIPVLNSQETQPRLTEQRYYQRFPNYRLSWSVERDQDGNITGVTLVR